MPRDGTITLTDLQAPFLHIVCEPCLRSRMGAWPARQGDVAVDQPMFKQAGAYTRIAPKNAAIAAHQAARALRLL
jgi:hypothetical protein